MLTLIGEKDREVDRMCLFDHSMKPPAEPPEGKKSSLYKTPAVFESLDLRAIDVSLCHLEDWLLSWEYVTFTILIPGDLCQQITGR